MMHVYNTVHDLGLANCGGSLGVDVLFLLRSFSEIVGCIV